MEDPADRCTHGPGPNLWAVSPVPHCASRNTGLPRNRAVVHASSDEPLYGFELVCGPHAVCPFRRDEPRLGETADRLPVSGAVRLLGAGVVKLGKHAGFRCPCSQELEGSSPSARTLTMEAFAQLNAIFTLAVRRRERPVSAFCAHLVVSNERAVSLKPRPSRHRTSPCRCRA
jgi:hypothetical protein